MYSKCVQYSVQYPTYRLPSFEIKFHYSVKGENRPLVTENKSYTLTVMREEVVWVWDCERKIERNQ